MKKKKVCYYIIATETTIKIIVCCVFFFYFFVFRKLKANFESEKEKEREREEEYKKMIWRKFSCSLLDWIGSNWNRTYKNLSPLSLSLKKKHIYIYIYIWHIYIRGVLLDCRRRSRRCKHPFIHAPQSYDMMYQLYNLYRLT